MNEISAAIRIAALETEVASLREKLAYAIEARDCAIRHRYEHYKRAERYLTELAAMREDKDERLT